MEPVILKSNSKTLKGTFKLTGSKSISNRLLIMRALSGSKVIFENLSESEDTKLLKFYLSFLDTCANSRIAMIVDTRNAGTVMRFITAFAAIQKGKWLITGHERMKERPLAPLVDSLRQLGADIEFTEKENFPPVKLVGKELYSKDISIDARQSSQFVSALMMIAPYLSYGLTINMEGKPVSETYIQMTAQLMQQANIDVEMDSLSIKIAPGDYHLKPVVIEPDWSSASYWYEMVALSDSADVFIEGLHNNSCQGDRALADIFESFGVKTEFTKEGIRIYKSGSVKKKFKYNFNNTPDIVPSVMVTCAALGIEATFTGINHLRLKESDRIEGLKKELAKIGTSLNKSGNEFILSPDKTIDEISDVEFDTYNDHRMAMSFAPLALKIETVKISNPGVVRKSYPGFWRDINTSGISVDMPEGVCS
jgi:3-phosphoshikimate 1-carboxyvinyltransferase